MGDNMISLRYIQYNENIINVEDANRFDSLIGEIIAKKEPRIRLYNDLGGTRTWVGIK